MSVIIESPLEHVSKIMRRHGANRIMFKLLANNDNSKQQIYVGGDEIIHLIPHGDLVGEMSKSDGPMYKAKVDLSWVDIWSDAPPTPATGAQLIYYPRYPEVRLSGFLRGSALAPSKLMQPPTLEEREHREKHNLHRCLVLGICPDGQIMAYAGPWDGELTQDAVAHINSQKASKIASVFYELAQPIQVGRELLLHRLKEIYTKGPVRSGRLDTSGELIDYQARNAAGYTLESLFGIIPNGRSEPDFCGWELKTHKSGALTLMTPEPDLGAYLEDLETFLLRHGRCGPVRRDFTGRHLVGDFNDRSRLTLTMEGYDWIKCEVSDPDGGLMLRDESGAIAAGWSFNKIITHWSRKHSQTAFVSYEKIGVDDVFYSYGPLVYFCVGPGLKSFLRALYSNAIYHDPGVKMELVDGRWRSKKRNQFRTTWRHIDKLYDSFELIDLSAK